MILHLFNLTSLLIFPSASILTVTSITPGTWFLFFLCLILFYTRGVGLLFRKLEQRAIMSSTGRWIWVSQWVNLYTHPAMLGSLFIYYVPCHLLHIASDSYIVCVSVSVSVGGVLSLGTYTVLFLKLYSYMDSNKWCREIRHAKAKRMTRSYSCKYISIGTAGLLSHCD